MSHHKRVEIALKEFQSGRPVILIDDPERENEGDLIIPAEKITDSIMNFMIRNGSGIVCLSLTHQHLKKLQLPQMVSPEENSSFRGTPFTISIDARYGITTGVSAQDRVKTVLDAISDCVTPNDLAKPGHIFPLQARDGGVLERQGHTEGALDLARLAGFKPAAVLCEIMNPDGTMTRGNDLMQFAQQHNLCVLSISDLMRYRLHHETLIADETKTNLPLEPYGEFTLHVFKEKFTHLEHLVLMKEVTQQKQSTLVRIHSSCQTGDLFASLRCDCYHQLHYSLQRIQKEGGLLIYLNQEGRGIGLFNKIKAYALQEQGLDTVDANLALGLPSDAREYYIATHILRKFNIETITLLTNNIHKLNALKNDGVTVVACEALPVFENKHNANYLRVKQNKLHTSPSYDTRDHHV